jgi:FkbM family methyltransferase
VTSTGLVLGIEPSNREYRRLKANLQLNRIESVIALQVAASDRAGFATMKIAEFEHVGQNTLGDFAYKINQQAIEQVRLMTLDDIVDAYLSSTSFIGVVKIDVEGAEHKVLLGARRILERHQPVILIELVDAALHYQGTNREEVLSLLQSLGYLFYIFGDIRGLGTARASPAS